MWAGARLSPSPIVEHDDGRCYSLLTPNVGPHGVDGGQSVVALVFDAFTIRFLDVGPRLLQALALAVMRISYQARTRRDVVCSHRCVVLLLLLHPLAIRSFQAAGSELPL